MKNSQVLPLLISLMMSNLFFPSTLSSQSSMINEIIKVNEAKKASKFDYFFFYGNEIVDGRDFSIVVNKRDTWRLHLPCCSSEVKEIGDDTFVLTTKNANKKLEVYNSGNKLIHTIPLPPGSYLSWDKSYILEEIEGDLWRSDIDFSNGKFINKKKVTELGIFRGRWQLIYSYKEWLLFSESLNSPTFILNTKTGSLENFTDKAGMYLSEVFNSPSGRFLVYHNRSKGGIMNFDITVFDFENSSVKKKNQLTTENYWVSDKHLFHLAQTRDSLWYELIDIETEEKTTFLSGENYRSGSSSYNFSPNGRYLFQIYKMLVGYSGPGEYIYFSDILSGNSISFDEDEVNSLYRNTMGEPTAAWVTNSDFLYVRSGDLTSQGTWIINMETNERKRITAYKADQVIPLPKTNLVYFYANKTLYKYNVASGELKEMAKDEKSVRTLAPFIHSRDFVGKN